MKRILSIIVCIAMILAAAISFAETYTVGIGQFAQHGSLDNCYQGFVEGLAEAGLVEGENLKIDLQNAQADMGIAQQIAAQFALTAKVEAGHEAAFLRAANGAENAAPVAWKCANCGHTLIGAAPPKNCPLCGEPGGWFETNH